jgi:phosphatidylserine/phosphatidylglycerophosphate/cardiolipin synthase-like enzyme
MPAHEVDIAVRDRVVIDPAERRDAFLRLIEAARERIALSMFRCTDFRIMDALAEALGRGVRVDLLLTQQAKGWEKKIRALGLYLESMGASVHRYAVAGVKYHAKYLVADNKAIVASLNLTAKCFESTADFLLVTEHPPIVSSLLRLFEHDFSKPGEPLPWGLSPRLIIGPDNARSRYMKLIQGVYERIQIVDHKIKDADMLALLATQEVNGRRVEVYSEDSLAPLKSHGKMMIVDGRIAVLGSISLMPGSLDTGRELAIITEDKECCARLSEFLQGARAGRVFGKPLQAVEGIGAEEEEED